MLAAVLPLSLALLAQGRIEIGSGRRAEPDTVVRQERVIQRDSSRQDTTRGPSFRRIPVTAEHLATAFADARARTLLGRAREARLEQDSTLLSYDATTYQRFSVGMGFKVIGRERLVLRHENSSRVRWHRDRGAVVDVTGSRSVVPVFMGTDVSADVSGTSSIPYYPGRDDLWFGAEVVEVDDDDDIFLIHPIAAGGEAYYRYSTGDSVSFRLPDGSTVRLIELRVRPREPHWRLGVGSLWFDASTAHLVRAVYRLSVPIDFWEILREEGDDEDIPLAARALMQPMKGSLNTLIVEHGLHEGRFWLPRAQMAEGEVQVGFARIPISIEERFEYASVNGLMDTLPNIPAVSMRVLDSLRADSLGLTGDERREWLRKTRQDRREAYDGACAAGATERASTQHRHSGAVPVLVRVPCDSVMLVTSTELPPSIFDQAEELFTRQDLEEAQGMLGFDAQAAFGPQRPTLFYGPTRDLLRYNRVEGLSAGIGARAELGQGLAAEAQAQIGIADWEPNGELSLERSDGARTVRVGLYRRLAAANDWGTPLAFGASLNAFLFGRDEGFYYRTLGAELVALGTRDARFEWRLFVERHDAAERQTHFSLANAINGLEFDPNIVADEGDMVGAGARWTRSWGLDPRRLRVFGDLRLEGGSGDFTFARGGLDLTMSRAITEKVSGALTVGGGTTAGDVPVQRLFFLGGTQTVRGQTAGTAAGNAYWLGRAELGTSTAAARPVIFFDIGWAGDRTDWREPGRPLSGAGVGASFMDGLLRFDIARGIWPRERWTANFHLEATF